MTTPTEALAQQPSAEPMKGWKLNHTRKGPEDGMAEIGYLDPEDDHFSPIVTVDTGLYYQADQAMPLAVAILGAIAGAAPQQTAPQAPTVQPLPARLVRFTLRDMQAERKRLDGFLALGNEAARAAEYDEWIAALEAYCGAHGITATTAPTPEAP